MSFLFSERHNVMEERWVASLVHLVNMVRSINDRRNYSNGEIFLLKVCGDWLPRSIFGKFYVICSIVRMIYLALYLLVRRCSSGLIPDLIFVDQVFLLSNILWAMFETTSETNVIPVFHELTRFL